MTVTMDARAYLQPEYVEGILNKKLEQRLDFTPVIKEQRTDATSFRYSEDLINAGDDIDSAVMGTPEELTEEAELALIDMSAITFKYGTMAEFGYQIKVNPRVFRETGIVDELQRAYVRAGFGLAKKVNDDIIAAVKGVSNNITEPAARGAKTWDDADADPIGTILDIAKAMSLENYDVDLDTLFLHNTNYYEMLDYMQAIDRRWSMDPTGGNTRQIPPVQGVSIFNTHSSQMSEGSYIGFDSSYKPITCYMYLNPAKSSHPADGRVMINRYTEQKNPQRIVIEMTMEYGLAIPVPNAIAYRASGI